jgi:hypothetical protein
MAEDQQLPPVRILIACMPKSGSTLLSEIIASLPGFTRVHLVDTYDRREQELCLHTADECLRKFGKVNWVAQHHVRNSEATQKIQKKYSLKTIVLIRNLYDIVPSLADHHRNQSIVYPMAYVPEDICKRDPEAHFKFIVDLVIPWYINFWASWDDCSDKLVVRYEDLIKDPLNVVQSILNYCSVEFKGDVAETVVQTRLADSASIRKNIGVTGRGDMLPQHCKDTINKFATYYPSVDFSRLGIDPS